MLLIKIWKYWKHKESLYDRKDEVILMILLQQRET